MANNGRDESEKLTLKHSNAPKRLYRDSDFFDDNEGDLNHTSFSCDHSNSSFSSKKFKASSYREQTLDSLDSDRFKSSFESPVLSDSIDSGTWFNSSASYMSSPPSASKSANLPSLDLNSMIQRYDHATLNSLSMSQMSSISEDAVSSPFPQTLEMASQSLSHDDSVASLEFSSQKTSTTSLSWSQSSVMLYSENAMTSPIRQTEDTTPLCSQNAVEISTELSYSHSQEEQVISGFVTTQSSTHNDSSCNNGGKAKTDNVTSVQDTSVIPNVGPKTTLPAFVSDNKSVDDHKDKEANPKKSSDEENLETKSRITDQDQVNVKLDIQNSEAFHSSCDKSKSISPSNNIDQSWNQFSGFERTVLESNSQLQEKFKKCRKNPGHEKFFTPSELKVMNLPPDIQHEDSVTFFQCLSKLVVQISVARTSDKRHPDDTYSSYIGTKKVRDGSGFIASTDKNVMKMKCTRPDCPHNTADNESFVCPESPLSPSLFDRSISNMSTCSTGSTSSTGSANSNSISGSATKKHLIYGGVYVHTNRHVIFDMSEAESACVNFFFHSGNKEGVVKGHVASIHGVNDEQDHVILHVMSHDRHLNDAIDLHLKNSRSSYYQMVKSTQNAPRIPGRVKLCWVAVISHPHGTASSISFGQLKKEETQPKRVIKYYDAATCPGSSGGLVITPTLLHLQWPGAVHSSFCQKTKYNVSLDSRCQELDATHIGRMNKNIINMMELAPENHYKL